MSYETDLDMCDFPFSCVLRAVKRLTSEVVVGAQCGSAVLRGAHVFVPGIVASPKCKTQRHACEVLKYVLFLFSKDSVFVDVFLKSAFILLIVVFLT